MRKRLLKGPEKRMEGMTSKNMEKRA